jgi:hypothetical protein
MRYVARRTQERLDRAANGDEGALGDLAELRAAMTDRSLRARLAGAEARLHHRAGRFMEALEAAATGLADDATESTAMEIAERVLLQWAGDRTPKGSPEATLEKHLAAPERAPIRLRLLGLLDPESGSTPTYGQRALHRGDEVTVFLESLRALPEGEATFRYRAAFGGFPGLRESRNAVRSGEPGIPEGYALPPAPASEMPSWLAEALKLKESGALTQAIKVVIAATGATVGEAKAWLEE